MTPIKTYLVQVRQLLAKLDTATGQGKIYDFLQSLTSHERDELWELCNTINSFNISSPFKLLQKQIESVEGKEYEERWGLEDLPSGAEIIKGEIDFISSSEALSFANHNINQLLAQL